MPTQSDRLTELRENTPSGQLPYISKSRLTKFVKCPEQFRYSYVQGLKEPPTKYTRRGTYIHETFEDYYHSVTVYVKETGEFPDDLVPFLPEWDRWADYTEPFISNFINFEYARMETAREWYDDEAEAVEAWLPVGIEAEAWLEDPLPWRDEQPPWMGYADAIYNDTTVPGVEPRGGVVITDFKTGKTPKKQYRDEGIYLEGEYYAVLFEQDWKVTAVAGYYPKGDDLVISPLKLSRRDFIFETVDEMLDLMEADEPHWPINETPLCKWGPGQDEQCVYYDICSSVWGEALKHDDQLREMVDSGMTPHQIASELGTKSNYVSYAMRKLNL
ncbi:RecB family exonuclease [Haloferax larsenii]|uniref:PD-(D/E)XK nuclease superfamily protein n=1 Tax=Haloferax larsenii TaxID=302484 RepID=A0A1H7N9U3_HALLR|nr:PD-(D/E)XK nuclease family protein [Haloferax larsenii]SEL20049.1 PD-(D/E)XK nuclease superfamily protein [Haloferax larsenii]